MSDAGPVLPPLVVYVELPSAPRDRNETISLRTLHRLTLTLILLVAIIQLVLMLRLFLSPNSKYSYPIDSAWIERSANLNGEPVTTEPVKAAVVITDGDAEADYRERYDARFRPGEHELKERRIKLFELVRED